MNYIYDIVLNFQENYYQFFEWSRSDKIKNITRIPIYRVSDQDLNILKNNQVKIDSMFLEPIKGNNKNHKKMMCLISNTKISIGLLFDSAGTLLKRSSLIFEEEDEANDYALNLEITKIPYIENIPLVHKDKLRVEIEKKDPLINYIMNLNDSLLIKYLYYEYFQKECENDKQMKQALKEELEKNWTKKQNDLYHLVTLIHKNNLSMKERTNSS